MFTLLIIIVLVQASTFLYHYGGYHQFSWPVHLNAILEGCFFLTILDYYLPLVFILPKITKVPLNLNYVFVRIRCPGLVKAILVV